MNGSLKKSSKILYGVCSCIIVLMVICYFGVSNSKGTYSAVTTVSKDCSSYGSNYIKVNGWCCPLAYSAAAEGGACYANITHKGKMCMPDNSCISGVTKINSCCTGGQVLKCPDGYVANSDGSCSSKNESSENDSSTKVSCSNVISGGCGQSTITSTNPNYTSCTINGTTYYYSKSTGGTCLDTTEGYTYTYYNYTKTGSTQVSCTRQYVNCDYDAQKEDCSDLGGTLNGTTCNIYSSGCKSDTFNCDSNVATTSNCYICLGTSGSVSTGGTYKQSTSSPGTNCHLTSSTTCSGTPVAKKYECTLTDKSKVCVTAYDSAWASAYVGETGTSCKEVTSCTSTPGGGNTGGGGTTTPSSSSSSKPSSSSSLTGPGSPTPSSNVDDNPRTGSVAIFMVWIIALGTLIYSFVYFKQSKFE